MFGPSFEREILQIEVPDRGACQIEAPRSRCLPFGIRTAQIEVPQIEAPAVRYPDHVSQFAKRMAPDGSST
jgi:hypothetical protein